MHQEILKKMVWENDYQSLCDCVERTIENIETIMMWQADSENPRKKHEAFIQKFSPDKGVLQLVEVDQKEFNFNPNEDIYVHFNDRSLLFKANIRKMSDDKVQVLVPKKFRIVENREQGRSSLAEQEIRAKLTINLEENSRANSFEFTVLDITNDGMGVLLSISKVKNFKVDQEIFLKTFGDVPLDSPVRCRVAHITKLDKRAELSQNKDYKIGMKFLSEIPFFMHSYEA